MLLRGLGVLPWMLRQLLLLGAHVLNTPVQHCLLALPLLLLQSQQAVAPPAGERQTDRAT